MPLTAQTYRVAAQERALEAYLMYSEGHYAVAHYLAGLALESLLFACRLQAGGQLDTRHRLTKLWDEANASILLVGREAQQAGEHVSAIVARWLNNHRYRSDSELRQWLIETGLAAEQKSKDDPLKHSARIITNAILAFMPLGEKMWLQLTNESGRC